MQSQKTTKMLRTCFYCCCHLQVLCVQANFIIIVFIVSMAQPAQPDNLTQLDNGLSYNSTPPLALMHLIIFLYYFCAQIWLPCGWPNIRLKIVSLAWLLKKTTCQQFFKVNHFAHDFCVFFYWNFFIEFPYSHDRLLFNCILCNFNDFLCTQNCVETKIHTHTLWVHKISLEA